MSFIMRIWILHGLLYNICVYKCSGGTSMKRKFKLCTLALMSLALVSCGGGSKDGPKDSSKPVNPSAPETNGNVKPSEPKTDFTIKTTDNGLTAEKDTYEISKLRSDEDKMFDGVETITLDVDTKVWAYVTALLESETKVEVEDESIIQSSAVTVFTVTNSELVGSGGSNQIEQIKLEIKRDLIKAGSTKIKFTCKPNNGSSSSNALTSVCFNVIVREFGDIKVDTYDVTVKADFTAMRDIITADKYKGATEVELRLADDERIYGYSADEYAYIKFPFSSGFGTIKETTFKYALGHHYSYWAYCTLPAGSTMHYNLTLKASSDYTIEKDQWGSDVLVINKNNAVLEFTLTGEITA